ncbi:MAG: LPS export ABC transporter permease LptF [Proteobacteria bacterium]|nr:LPS export ABC transporter permease LptF [Pseudomonadota bacterium]
MTRIINRYIAKEITVPFFLGLSIFTFILLMDKMLKLIELVVSKGVKLSEMMSIIVFILPSFFAVTIPMAFLLALLLAFGRLSGDEELTAIKSSGLSLFQMMPPVIALSVVTFIITLLLMVYVLPWGNYSFRIMMYDIVKRKADTGIVPGRLVDSFEDMILYVKEKDQASGRYKGVLISEEKSGKKSRTITAREGEIFSKPDNLSVTLRLYDGAIHREGEKERQYKVINFSTYDITLSMNFKGSEAGGISKGDRELSLSEIRDRIEVLKERGEAYNYLLVEFHKKFSIPFACIVFSFIGVPLGIQGKRSGKAYGFTISLLLITIYYIFLLTGEAIGDKGKIPPFLSMWAPNIFFLILGFYLLIKANAEKEVRVLSIFTNSFAYTTRTLKKLFRR